MFFLVLCTVDLKESGGYLNSYEYVKVFPRRCGGYFEKFQYLTNLTMELKYPMKSGDCVKILYIRHLENGDIKTWQTPRMLGIRVSWSFTEDTNIYNISRYRAKFENDFYNINFRKLAYMLDAASRKGRVSTKKIM